MTTRLFSLICGSLFLACCAAQALAQGTNTGPGTQTNPGGIVILGQPYGSGSANPPPPVTPGPTVLETNPTRNVIRRSQAREYYAAGRVVTGRVYTTSGGLQRITYREYLRAEFRAGNGDDNDLIDVALGPEKSQDFNPPVMLHSNLLVLEAERDSLMNSIGQWNQRIGLANQHMDGNSQLYYASSDPKQQAWYAHCHQLWAADKKTREAELLNLQFQMLVRQE